MTWPSSDVPTTGMDAGTDTPPRGTFLAWAQAFNQMRAHVSTYMQGLLGSADAATARATLDVPSRAGGNATGTWGISISGNAATATTASNVSRSVTGAGLATGGGALTADQIITVTEATTVDAQAGTGTGVMTARRTAEAVAAQAKMLGNGQSWQPVTRTGGTVYQNTTGRTIFIAISGTGNYTQLFVGEDTSTSVRVAYNNAPGSGGYEQYHISAPIPSGWYYKITGGFSEVRELR